MSNRKSPMASVSRRIAEQASSLLAPLPAAAVLCAKFVLVVMVIASPLGERIAQGRSALDGPALPIESALVIAAVTAGLAAQNIGDFFLQPVGTLGFLTASSQRYAATLSEISRARLRSGQEPSPTTASRRLIARHLAYRAVEDVNTP